MNTGKTIWMGLGIFERLYSEAKILEYFKALDALPNKKVFILADEITGCNNFVLSGRKFDRIKDSALLDKYKIKAREKFIPRFNFIKSLIASQSSAPDNWQVYYWNFLSSSPEYQGFLGRLQDGIQRFENHYLKKEVLQTTIFGFGARLRKNFTASFVDFVFDKNFYRYLDTLSEYTVEELAAIFYLSRKGWIKAGHEEEKPYDSLSGMCYERFKDDFLAKSLKPEFYYLQ